MYADSESTACMSVKTKCPTEQQKSMGSMPDLKVGPVAKFCSFPLEAAHMFPEAARTAPPGRTERGGGRRMSVSICPWIWGADRPLHLPLEKQGSLEQILSKMAAMAQLRLAKDGIGYNKTACGPKNT